MATSEAGRCRFSHAAFINVTTVQIDSEVKEMFFGWTVAAYSIGQLVASPLFGFLSNWTKRCRWVFVLCLCSALLANCLYVLVELFPTNRRYAIMIARLFMGVAAGQSATI
ncbi:hypothetical protein D918_09086 [Trichuris suis]|nr:hypothetical protein D918_09086 [Trichuris suis]